MKDFDILVNNINKLGGVKCSPSESDFAHTERPSAHVSVRKVAFLVSALWLTVSSPLFFASCAEEEDVIDENTRQTLNEGQSDADTTNIPDAVISDWTDGEAGDIVPMTEEEIERLLKEWTPN